jgi:hypothetical protein
MHTVSSPEVRALAHKVENPLTTVFGVSPWSEEQKQLDAKEFEVPSGTQILLMFPEIFDRDILLKDLKFHCKYTDIKGKPQTGVKTPCPWCNSNAHVVFSDKAGYKEASIAPLLIFGQKFQSTVSLQYARALLALEIQKRPRMMDVTTPGTIPSTAMSHVCFPNIHLSCKKSTASTSTPTAVMVLMGPCL